MDKAPLLMSRWPELRGGLRNLCRQETSCEDACGSGRNEVDSGQQPSRRFCSCDVMCSVYRDCCHDFRSRCPTEMAEFENTNQLTVMASSNVECRTVDAYFSVMVVTGCPRGDGPDSSMGTHHHGTAVGFAQVGGAPNSHSNRRRSSLDLNDDGIARGIGGNRLKRSAGRKEKTTLSSNILVTDLQLGITYANEDVFTCNNLGRLKTPPGPLYWIPRRQRINV